MRPLLLILFSFLFFAFIGGDKDKNDKRPWRLNGEIKSIVEYWYYEKKVQPGSVLADTVISSGSFKISGDSVEYESKDRFDEKDRETLYDDTALREHPHFGIKRDESPFGVHIVTNYDDRRGTANMTIDQFFDNKNRKQLEQPFYDGNGTIIKAIDSNLYDASTTLFWYNPKGFVVKAIQRDVSGKVIERRYSRYNSKGDLILLKSERGKIFSGRVYARSKFKPTYNSKGRLVKLEEKHRDSHAFADYKSTDVFNYDDSGRIISDVVSKYSYNIRNSTKYGQFDKFYYRYLNFDSHRNWLKMVEIKNDSLMTVTEREIEYYQ